MEFIIENYIWFIIGGVILVMTIIGFIAEKTNFGQKTKKEKIVKEKKPVEEVKTEVVVPIVETPTMDFPEPILEPIAEPFVEPEVLPEPVLEETKVEEPLEEIKENIVEQIIDVKESDFEEAIEPIVIEEKPELPQIEEVIEEEASDENSLWKF